MKRLTALATTAVVGLLALGVTTLSAAEPPSPETIQAASTAADHNRIAETYAKEAEELRTKAADHKAMLASYDKGPGYLKQKSGLVQHCKSLIGYYAKAAQDAEAMAKMHREMAAKAKQ